MTAAREPRETRIAVAVVAAVLTASVLLSPGDLPAFALCPSAALFELPCPGCGMTRAFLALGHGHFAEAWRLNALALPLFATAIAFLFRPARALLARTVGARTAIAVFTLAWVWNFARLASGG